MSHTVVVHAHYTSVSHVVCMHTHKCVTCGVHAHYTSVSPVVCTYTSVMYMHCTTQVWSHVVCMHTTQVCHKCDVCGVHAHYTSVSHVVCACTLHKCMQSMWYVHAHYTSSPYKSHVVCMHTTMCITCVCMHTTQVYHMCVHAHYTSVTCGVHACVCGVHAHYTSVMSHVVCMHTTQVWCHMWCACTLHKCDVTCGVHAHYTSVSHVVCMHTTQVCHLWCACTLHKCDTCRAIIVKNLVSMMMSCTLDLSCVEEKHQIHRLQGPGGPGGTYKFECDPIIGYRESDIVRPMRTAWCHQWQMQETFTKSEKDLHVCSVSCSVFLINQHNNNNNNSQEWHV